jgi:hypothetical protein
MHAIQVLRNGGWVYLLGLRDIVKGDVFRYRVKHDTWSDPRTAKASATRRPHPKKPTITVWCVDELYDPVVRS